MDTRVADLAPLAGLTALHNLDLRNTRVADLSVLAPKTGLADARASCFKLESGIPQIGEL